MGGKGGLFRYADGAEMSLMLIGTLGILGDGLMSPLNMFVLSGIIDEYGTANLSIANEVVDKYALRLLYVALGVGLSAFLGMQIIVLYIDFFLIKMLVVCFYRRIMFEKNSRERSRIRTEYLKSTLRQEGGFFDSQGASSSTFKVVSSIFVDTHSIQGVIVEKGFFELDT
ncbi:ABC transporter B family member 17-like [Primulina huaijiensis]|uniref:ABC transporter B family member 17-like n=1 Tax=Primulina huaijiensis TaxID=1492673 RepID=UPI003CC6E666